MCSSLRLALVVACSLCASLGAKERTATPGRAENAEVSVDASAFLTKDEVKQVLGADFNGYYTVLRVTVTPKAGSLTVHRDDFLLRTDKDGEQTRPLAPSQIGGQADMVLHQVQGSASVGTERTGPIWGGNPSIGAGPVQLPGNGGMGGNGASGTSTTATAVKKTQSKPDPMIDVLKKKMLPEGSIGQPASGLLVFDLEKQKLKDLELVYSSSKGPLKIRFR